MIKKKNDLPEEFLSPEELCDKTKNTLKNYIKANTFVGFATGLAAGVTLCAAPTVEDTNKKILLGSTGVILTAASVGMIAASFKRMDEFIDNHDDIVKLQVVGRFLDAKGEEAKENLLDLMLDEFHSNISNNPKEKSDV